MITKEFKQRFFTSLILLLIVLIVIFSNFFLTFVLIVLGVFSLIEFFNITKKIFYKKINYFIFNLIFILYIFIFCLIFFYLSQYYQLKIILYALLLCCIFSDIGGFIFGKIFKGPKLTRISPNKTFSGALGSIFSSVLILSTIFFYFTGSFEMKIIILGIITSLANQLGDLFFSFLKRKANIKNTGKILPGHGGILDRLDGILFGLPLGLMSLMIIY